MARAGTGAEQNAGVGVGGGNCGCGVQGGLPKDGDFQLGAEERVGLCVGTVQTGDPCSEFCFAARGRPKDTSGEADVQLSSNE